MVRQKTIAIDIDDVLARNAEGFAAYSNERWGTGMLPEHYTEEWAVAWKVPPEEALNRADELHTSGAIGRYAHFEDAVHTLKHLHSRFDLIVVTSRRSILKPETDRWLEKHFPGIFSGVRFAGIWDTTHDVQHKLNQTKAELCRELGAHYLI